MHKQSLYRKHCLTRNELKTYLNGSLPRHAVEAIEQHLTTCEFCNAAVEGYKSLPNHESELMLTKANTMHLSRQNAFKKRSGIKNKIIIALATAASVASVITMLHFMEKPLSNDYVSAADYSIELSKNIIPPPPPPRDQPLLTDVEPAMEDKTGQTGEPKFDKKAPPPIKLNKRNPITNGKLSRQTPKKNEIIKQKLKTVSSKHVAETNVIIPKEKIRYGYSYSDKIITIQFTGLADNTDGKKLPSFQGNGLDGFVNYIQRNLRYPRDAYAKNIQGTVVIHFTIAIDGSVTDVQLVNKVHPSVDREALRVIESSPKWFPATSKNRVVPVQVSCPVNFIIK